MTGKHRCGSFYSVSQGAIIEEEFVPSPAPKQLYPRLVITNTETGEEEVYPEPSMELAEKHVRRWTKCFAEFDIPKKATAEMRERE